MEHIATFKIYFCEFCSGGFVESLIHKLFLKYVDIFLPNACEAMSLTSEKSAGQALTALASVVRTIAIKQGDRGVLATDGDKTIAASAFRTKVVDTTGAGDSFNAGFVYQCLQGVSLEECLIWGNACGAISTTQQGGTIAFPDREGIEKFLYETQHYLNKIPF